MYNFLEIFNLRNAHGQIKKVLSVCHAYSLPETVWPQLVVLVGMNDGCSFWWLELHGSLQVNTVFYFLCIYIVFRGIVDNDLADACS